MSENRVTQEQIQHLMDTAEIVTECVFGKCTTMAMKLENGFVLTSCAACVDPANYDEKIGKQICLDNIESHLWELEGYALQKKLHEERANQQSAH